MIATLSKRIASLEEMVRLHKQRCVGASSEESPDQQEMFNEAELTDAAEQFLSEQGLSEQETAPAQETMVPAPQDNTNKKPGRKPLPKDLPRIWIEHNLPEEEKRCACGCQRIVMREETSEQLEIIPATMQVIVSVRKKYACKQCEGSPITAAMPPQPIPKSNTSPGLLAHIATSRFQDALPLYRQEAILQRSGFYLGRNTLVGWMIKSGELI